MIDFGFFRELELSAVSFSNVQAHRHARYQKPQPRQPMDAQSP
jgi:hypothetical protein